MTTTKWSPTLQGSGRQESAGSQAPRPFKSLAAATSSKENIGQTSGPCLSSNEPAPPGHPETGAHVNDPAETTFLGAWTLKFGLGFGIDSRLSTGREWAGVEELSTFHPMRWCKPSSFFPFLFFSLLTNRLRWGLFLSSLSFVAH